MRVVAPTSVNRGRSRRSVRADGPCPSTTSSWKSSIAGYSTSSTTRLSRWISSMKRTSWGSSAVSTAARSPLRSSTGPLVTWKPTPISVATMPASEVLPSPGGPASSTWSRASPRWRAASRKIESCCLTPSCPMKSPIRRGRSERSSSSSAPMSAAAASRSPPGSPGPVTGAAAGPGRAARGPPRRGRPAPRPGRRRPPRAGIRAPPGRRAPTDRSRLPRRAPGRRPR